MVLHRFMVVFYGGLVVVLLWVYGCCVVDLWWLCGGIMVAL